MKNTLLAWLSKKAMILLTIGIISVIVIPQYAYYKWSIDGGYSEWGAWSRCTFTCGERIKGRNRNCSNPAPRGSGKSCERLGIRVMITPCPLVHCPQDGGWGAWGQWSECKPNCKSGLRTRAKQCDHPKPMYGGLPCYGQATVDTVKCDHLSPCPIDGGVGLWGAWKSCSVTCGNGTRARKRLCNQPAPAYNGKNCSEPLADVGKCKLPNCLVPVAKVQT